MQTLNTGLSRFQSAPRFTYEQDVTSFERVHYAIGTTINHYLTLLHSYFALVKQGLTHADAEAFLLPRQAIYKHYAIMLRLLTYLDECFRKLVASDFTIGEPGILLASLLDFVDVDDDVMHTLTPAEKTNLWLFL